MFTMLNMVLELGIVGRLVAGIVVGHFVCGDDVSVFDMSKRVFGIVDGYHKTVERGSCDGGESGVTRGV